MLIAENEYGYITGNKEYKPDRITKILLTIICCLIGILIVKNICFKDINIL